MKRIIAYTHAYNAEKTLKCAVDSVISQDFCSYTPTYILIDNGASDSTGLIIDDYAKKHDWILPIHNKQNIPSQFSKKIEDILNRFQDEGYLFMLDADDEYAPDFLARALAFMTANNLDIAACGSDFVDTRTTQIYGARRLERDMIIYGMGFSKYFPQYHQFTRTVWGKVFSLSLLRKCSFEQIKKLTYGRDTAFTLEAFRNAERVGILSGTLHKYYVSPKSVSYQFDAKRIESDHILHKAALDFLIEKCGSVSSRNESFLMLVYMNALRDTLNVLLNARIPSQEKLSCIIDMFTHEYAGQLMAREHLGLGLVSVSEQSALRQELLSVAAKWLLSLREVPDQFVERYCDVGEQLSAATEEAGQWLFFKKLRIRFFLEQNRRQEARDRLSELIELIPNDPEVAELQMLL